ncbi:MAG: winged helix-turn-helix transcriptional regulator [Gammaproteobacteria bacterium]|nr:winged helix-turn-helix transcriptional regulator [Gammaproteobacteria bacterium]
MVKYNSDQLNTIFGALSDPTRRAILARLVLGEATVTELATPFDMSLPAISKHLRILETADLIQREKHGRVHRLQLNAGPLKDVVDWIANYKQFWESQFDSLENYLNKKQEQAKSVNTKEKKSCQPLARLKKLSKSAVSSTRRVKKSSVRGPTRKN